MVGPLVNVRAGVELHSEPVAQLEFGQRFEVCSIFIHAAALDVALIRSVLPQPV